MTRNSVTIVHFLFAEEEEEKEEEEGSTSFTYWSEDMYVLAAGDEMGILSSACGSFKLVSCQHPHLHKTKIKKIYYSYH